MSNKTTKVALQSALPSKKEEETRILNWDKASKILDLNRTESLRLVNEGKLLLSETKKIGLDDKCFTKSSATLHIPVEKLKSLPIGAVFTSKSGQATATVRYIHDTLYIVANSCAVCLEYRIIKSSFSGLFVGLPIFSHVFIIFFTFLYGTMGRPPFCRSNGGRAYIFMVLSLFFR